MSITTGVTSAALGTWNTRAAPFFQAKGDCLADRAVSKMRFLAGVVVLLFAASGGFVNIDGAAQHRGAALPTGVPNAPQHELRGLLRLRHARMLGKLHAGNALAVGRLEVHGPGTIAATA